MSRIQPSVVRRPPTNAKLERLVAEAAANGYGSPARDAAEHAIEGLAKRGLPSGLDPAVVAAAITELMPYPYVIVRLVKHVGSEYDDAIVAGLRTYRERHGITHVLDKMLLAVLTEHGRVSFVTAYERLFHAQEAVGRDPSTNLPADRSPAVLDSVSAAMDPWFSPKVVAHTLALANQGMPPTTWSNDDTSGVVPPQGDEEWALFIGCALHPSEAAAALLAKRCKLIPRLDEPARTAVCDVLEYAHDVHGALVPLPPR